jgi:hypothetical protein
LKFNKKTKESSKIKSITKYLSKEFGVDFWQEINSAIRNTIKTI